VDVNDTQELLASEEMGINYDDFILESNDNSILITKKTNV